MKRWKFIGAYGRVWPSLSLEVEPGEVVDAETNPDPLWFVPADPEPVVVDAPEAN